jgi:hypothetical protein
MKAIPIVAVLADRYRYKPRKLLKAAYKQLRSAQETYHLQLNALECRIAELRHTEDDLKACKAKLEVYKTELEGWKADAMTLRGILCMVRNDSLFKSLAEGTYEEVEGYFEDLERRGA